MAFNVLVGLTVDDIRKFQGNADLRKLSMRLEFIRQVEQASFFKKDDALDNKITKETTFGATIWMKIESS